MSTTIGEASGQSAPAFSEEATRVSGRRFLAHFVDGLIYSLAALAAMVPLFLLAAMVDHTAAQVIYVAGLIAIITVGHVWFLVLLHKGDGRSPGKKAAGIRVVDAQGRPPTTAMLWKRNWPVLFEYIYLIAFIGMMTSRYRQRLGDRLADTYVVQG